MSLNAVVFNGIDSKGAAHSTLEFQNGDTDILTSREIDLSTYSSTSGLFLSFFYEKKGNGELPTGNESIRVEFLNEDSVWRTDISQSDEQDAIFTADEVVEIDSFYQILLPINEDQYFSNKFRFRFVSTGTQNGLFDTWLIDYVYLNEGRTVNDTLVRDRTFTKPISSPFKNYYSMPMNHFVTNPSKMSDFMGSQYVQLGLTNGVQQYELNTNIYFINDGIYDTIPNQQLATFRVGGDNDVDISGGAIAYYRKEFKVETILKFTDVPTTVEYAEVHAELLGSDWDDGLLDVIDLNINDTIRNTFILDNYYAYDDGSAERGAGVNNTESQLAYKFGISILDSISAVDIYFPKNIKNVQTGKLIKFKIWENSNGLPGAELFTKDISIRQVDTLNQFYRYELTEKIAVADTFYIGWEQLSNDRIYVGLDKNTDSSDRIFFNISGDWEQNKNDITGSLMMRPVFAEIPEEPYIHPDSITGLDKNQFETSIRLHPNPTSGILHIEGEYDQVDILSLNGRIVNTSVVKEGQSTTMNLYGLRQGMYIVRLRKDDIVITKKLILNQ
jgi:hypothetical protein